ncbi:helix-turn-helix domain-containing protein [Candidatus Parvarchaeota archaeon]|nr:helix-turn-helix domain-containing protein [Candidatus Parvarchaeota archaeon]
MMTRIAYKLKLAREMAGLSQNQVANFLGLKRPAISEIEAGRRKVSAEELAELSRIYSVSINWLVGESEEEDENQIRMGLAARELSKLKPEDVDRLLKILSALRHKGDDN